MINMTTIELAREIMSDSFIGPDELRKCSPSLSLLIPSKIPEIPYAEEKLREVKNDYFLILGVSQMTNNKNVTINNLKSVFGKDPDVGEPCFYNQDWYDQEEFINIPLQENWYLIRKGVFEDSRAVMPNELMKSLVFPSAVLCTYSFFVIWLSIGEKIWYHDFVWCSDVDHNGDRIYVGKYHDVDGVNKNGFSIHRHLALRPCYGAVDCM